MNLNFGMNISPKIIDNPIEDLDDVCPSYVEDFDDSNFLFLLLLKNYQAKNLNEG